MHNHAHHQYQNLLDGVGVPLEIYIREEIGSSFCHVAGYTD
jgi:hypothetical protein